MNPRFCYKLVTYLQNLTTYRHVTYMVRHSKDMCMIPNTLIFMPLLQTEVHFGNIIYIYSYMVKATDIYYIH